MTNKCEINLKKSKIAAIIIIIVAIILSIIVNANQSKEIQRYHDNLKKEIVKCNENIDNIDKIDDYETYCDQIKKNENIKVDTLTSFSNILIFRLKFINPMAILLVLIPSLIEPIYILKNKYIINCNNRIGYKKFFIFFVKTAYKYVWILPLTGILIYIPTLFYSTLSPQYQLINGYTFWETNLIKYPFAFIALYSLNLLMYSITFVNMGLICSKKKPRYLLSIIFTYIIYVLIQLFFELIINDYILISIFHTEFGYIFNIMNMFIFSDQFGLTNLLIFSFIIMVLSFFGLYFSYRNKEKFIIDIEKN